MEVTTITKRSNITQQLRIKTQMPITLMRMGIGSRRKRKRRKTRTRRRLREVKELKTD
jgi:hypothetical protein